MEVALEVAAVLGVTALEVKVAVALEVAVDRSLWLDKHLSGGVPERYFMAQIAYCIIHTQ